MLRFFLISLLLVSNLGFAQHKVDPKNTYNRLICVVPMVGTGKVDDPRRPQYAPWPPPKPGQAPARNAIIAYTHLASDDGKLALVEFVALDRAAFAGILNDKSVTSFHKGKDKKEDIEKELRKYRKDFDLNSFGLVMP